MAINLTLFRNRSPVRDLERDRSRFSRIRLALEAAKAEAEAEGAGLQKRIDTHLLQGVALIESLQEYGKRSAEDEQGITELENRAKAGRQRVAELGRQIVVIDQMLADLGRLSSEVEDQYRSVER